MKNLLLTLAQIDIDPTELDIPKTDTPADVNALEPVLTIVFGLLGVVSMLVIVLAGVRFILSRGDPQKTTNARNTIIYAAVGLVISILAFTIVRFVVGSI